MTDDESQDGIAEEFESFVAGESFARDGGVGQGGGEDVGVFERVVEENLCALNGVGLGHGGFPYRPVAKVAGRAGERRSRQAGRYLFNVPVP